MSSTPLWLKCAMHVGVVQTRHRDLADAHLEEGRERGEDADLASLAAKAAGRREVAALHDAAAHEDLGVLLADVVQAAGALEIVVEDAHTGDPLLRRQAVEELVYDLAEVITVLADAARALDR
jgi:hypothetical protein